MVSSPSPGNFPNPLVEPDAFRKALLSGEWLTPHQAAKLIDVPLSTFNYHLRQGHIPSVPSPTGWGSYVTRQDTLRFAGNLARWRSRTGGFDWLAEEETAHDHDSEDTPDAPDASDAVAASA